MTIDDIEWLLRYPCDAITMTKETLNKVQSVIAGTGRMAEGVKYITTYDANQRIIRAPVTLADRPIKVVDAESLSAQFGLTTKAGVTHVTFDQ